MPRLEPARLLLIEDERTPAPTQQVLAAHHTVDHATSWREGLLLAAGGEHHLILVDRGIPHVDGLSLVRLLRASKVATPMLLLSTLDSAQAHREALEAGADDHLVQPFEVSDLLARVASLARPPLSRDEPDVLRAADLELDLQTRTATRSGRTLRLGPRDFDMLTYLARHRGRVVTHASLVRHVWAPERAAPRAIRASASRIRAEVDHGFAVELIHTVHGVGYVLLGED